MKYDICLCIWLRNKYTFWGGSVISPLKFKEHDFEVMVDQNGPASGSSFWLG